MMKETILFYTVIALMVFMGLFMSYFYGFHAENSVKDLSLVIQEDQTVRVQGQEINPIYSRCVSGGPYIGSIATVIERYDDVANGWTPVSSRVYSGLDFKTGCVERTGVARKIEYGFDPGRYRLRNEGHYEVHLLLFHKTQRFEYQSNEFIVVRGSINGNGAHAP